MTGKTSNTLYDVLTFIDLYNSVIIAAVLRIYAAL